MLSAMGCDNGQGYLFSHPVEAERIQELLDAEPAYEDASSARIG